MEILRLLGAAIVGLGIGRLYAEVEMRLKKSWHRKRSTDRFKKGLLLLIPVAAYVILPDPFRGIMDDVLIITSCLSYKLCTCVMGDDGCVVYYCNMYCKTETSIVDDTVEASSVGCFERGTYIG